MEQPKKEIRGYQLRQHLGTGGFGAVYLAHQPAINREVAIKVVLPKYANQPEFIRRFEAEAQVIARLEHFHIVTLYDYWREPDGAFLVMRYLRGGSLRDHLETGGVALSLVARFMEQIGSALLVAHQNEVIHRDLKPDNILMDEQGNAYLADFGIARWLGHSAFSTDPASSVIGSPAYIPPEYIAGGDISPSSDIYSLGILLFEMLTGQLPFDESNIGALLLKHMHDPVPSVNTVRQDLPEALDMVVQRATAKDPDDRYANVRDMVLDFRDALRDVTDEAGKPVVDKRSTGTFRTTSQQLQPRSVISDVIVGVNPYKGLRAFEESDAADFFGRTDLVERLVDRLTESGPDARFLAVVGPSGSGKSSVVKAGLVPRLREMSGSAEWYILEMTPGDHPFEELESALLKVATEPIDDLSDKLQQDEAALARFANQVVPSNQGEILLVIDQFEELFTQVEDPNLRERFLAALLAAVHSDGTRLRIVVTLRADFYDRPLLHPEFGELMRVRTELVLPMSPSELEQAIVGPADRVGLQMETGLVAAIVQDVASQVGALPLLQYALTELFERRRGNLLTLQAYDESGGVLGALARRADELYVGLDEDRQRATRQLFLRLVVVGEGTDDTRRRVMRPEIAAMGDGQEVMEEVIRLYGQYRLLTFDHDPAMRLPTVEIAHEALIRTWIRLREWLDANRADLRLQRRLTQVATEWKRAAFDRSYLATGSRLIQFEEFATHTALILNDLEISYLNASLERRSQEEAAERERQQRERQLEERSRNRLRMLVVVMTVAAIGAVVLMLLAFAAREEARVERDNAESARATSDINAQIAQEQRDEADVARKEAERSAEEAFSLSLASEVQLALRAYDSDLALVLGLEANSIPDPPPQAERALAQAAYTAGTLRVFDGHTAAVTGVDFNAAGTMAISTGQDNEIILWDVETGAELNRFEGHTEPVLDAVFLPGDGQILSSSADYSMRLWDIETGETLLIFGGHSGNINAVAVSPNGQFAASGSSDKGIILWNLETGRPIKRFVGHTDAVQSVRFSADGRFVVSGGSDGLVFLWDANPDAETSRLERFLGHDGPVWTVDIAPDGKTIISGSEDETLILWDVETGRSIRQFNGHSGPVYDLHFSPDGRTVLSSSQDGTVIHWLVETGAPLQRLIGHTRSVMAVAFSPDGQRALSGSVDETMRLWALQSNAQLSIFEGHTENVFDVAINPDAQYAMSSSSDGRALYWDIQTGEIIYSFNLHRDWVRTVAINNEGTLALTGGDDHTVRFWNLRNGGMRWVFDGHTDAVRSVDFSPDSNLAVSASDDGSLILWDLVNFEEVLRFGDILDNTTAGTIIRAHEGPVLSASFSADGRYILSGGEDGTVRLWDVQAGGAPVDILNGHFAPVLSVVFSADGQQALSGAADGDIILWNLETGRRLSHFNGHNGPVNKVMFGPEGRFVLSGSSDHTIRLWDLATGEEVRRYPGHDGGVQSVDFSPDGEWILSGGGDTVVRRWRVDDTLADLITWTETNRYIRELTCEERRLYRVEPLCEPINQLDDLDN